MAVNDTDRILGELKEFKRSSIEKFNTIEGRFNALDEKVDSIVHWRWKITGGLTVIIALVELANVVLRD